MEMPNFYKKFFISSMLIIIFVLLNANLPAQHRGDNHSFQGLMNNSNLSVKSSAMGGAFTALSGDLSSLFFNPAGLSRIKQIQVSAAANNYSKHWRENQDYRPDRYFVTLPFYLEGLYIPDPANNGKWDYQLAQDTNYNYIVKEPKLGVDAYGEEAADWTEQKDNFGLTNLAGALPFQLGEMNFVAALSYNVDNSFYDFDRNDTYLDPHIGYFDYGGDISRVDGQKTLNMKWSRYLRERIGKLNNITGGIAVEVLPKFMIGAGFNLMWGESDDRLSITRVGDFLLSNQQRFTFSYMDGSFVENGTSKYSSTSLNVGFIYEFNRFTIGAKATLPYTIKREWNYSQVTTDTSTTSLNVSGEDNFEIPALFSFGISFNPADKFIIAFDYEYAPYSKAKYNLQSNDPTFRKWVDRNIIRFGIEYKALDFISILAGYQSIPQVYIPDGAAVTDRGPEANSYNVGVSLNLFFGRIDLAYELRVLRYYDSYFSNTNYAFEKSGNLMIGYTYIIK
jgi:long-subunit fatty acid transport protein